MKTKGTETKKWSKKKKVMVIVFSIVAFLLVAIICGGIVALNWYCKVSDYEVQSAQSIVTQDTKIIAHRGFRAVAPENTLPAFVEAGKSGFWGAECDTYRTKDGIWVIQHDVNTYRMMDLTKSIEKCTYEELLKYRTDNGNHIDQYPDLKICTLDEYLQACADYNMTAVIELKGKNNTEHYDEIIASTQKYDCDIVYISFQEENLLKLRELSDDPMYYLVHTVDEESIEVAKKIGNCGIDFNGNKEENYENDGAILKKCQEEGLSLGAWTIDDIKVMDKLVNTYGVEYITTDCITY